MAQQKTQHINKIKRRVKEYLLLLKQDRLPVKKVYLYGSQVRGNFKQWSDVDVCIISPRFKSRWDAFEYLWSKRRKIDVRRGIEPIGYPPKDFVDEDPLVYEIKRTGMEIK